MKICVSDPDGSGSIMSVDPEVLLYIFSLGD
jgi:hypothetical protein